MEEDSNLYLCHPVEKRDPGENRFHYIDFPSQKSIIDVYEASLFCCPAQPRFYS